MRIRVKRKLVGVSLLAGTVAMTGCSSMQLGEGGSMVTGSAGDAGAQGAAKELVHCSVPVGTVALDENPSGYSYRIYYNTLPQSPLPLLKLMMQQTGCFRVVSRGAGLSATRQELALQSEGLLRRQKNVTKGNVVEAHFTLIPDIIFTEHNAGGATAALGAFIPHASTFTALAGGVKFREAQALLTLTDNNTTEQVAAAEGSAKATDFGAGGAILGTLAGGAAAGWARTNEGKVVAAALMDAINKLVPQMRAMGPAAPIPEKRR